MFSNVTGGRRNIATKWMRPGPGIWKSGKFEIQQITKIKTIEIKIRSAQNVGKVWISRKKQLPAPFGAIWGNFSMGRKHTKKWCNFAYFAWWANGPYSPALGSRWQKKSQLRCTSFCYCALCGDSDVGRTVYIFSSVITITHQWSLAARAACCPLRANGLNIGNICIFCGLSKKLSTIVLGNNYQKGSFLLTS